MKKYPSVGDRFVAGLVDGLVFFPLVIPQILIDSYGPPPHLVLIIWFLIAYNAGWVYSVVLHGLYGQTVGKMVLRIKVVDAVSEVPITMRQAFLRDAVPIIINVVTLPIAIYYILTESPDSTGIVATVDMIVNYAALAWFVAEIVTCMTNEKRRALHDYIAGTVVVRPDALGTLAADSG